MSALSPLFGIGRLLIGGLVLMWIISAAAWAVVTIIPSRQVAVTASIQGSAANSEIQPSNPLTMFGGDLMAPSAPPARQAPPATPAPPLAVLGGQQLVADAPAPPVRPPVTRGLVVAADGLHLRADCSSRSTSLAVLRRGWTLTPAGPVVNGWRTVEWAGRRGCVSAQYVTVIN